MVCCFLSDLSIAAICMGLMSSRLFAWHWLGFHSLLKSICRYMYGLYRFSIKPVRISLLLLLFVGCCLFVVCCLLLVVCALLFVVCDVCCVLFVVCCFLLVNCMHGFDVVSLVCMVLAWVS